MKKYKLKKTIWFVKIIPFALKQWDNLTWLDLSAYNYIFVNFLNQVQNLI